MKLGLLGGGSIAGAVAHASAAGHLPHLRIIGVTGSKQPASERVRQTAETAGTQACSLNELLAQSPDWVLEAAGASAVRKHLRQILASSANVIIMSIGALLDEELWKLVQHKRQQGGQVLLPSGAIGGLDAISALNALDNLEQVEITTTKAPAGLQGAPYLLEQNLTLPADERVTVFEGSALEAVAGFPANVNVAAALSLSGIGPERTLVRIVSDPAAQRTRHEIVAAGPTGRVTLQIESAPSPGNPASSYLAPLSAIATLKSLRLLP